MGIDVIPGEAAKVIFGNQGAFPALITGGERVDLMRGIRLATIAAFQVRQV